MTMSQMRNRKVFAHYLVRICAFSARVTNPILTSVQVGLTLGHSKAQWEADICAARQAGIDGFAMNIGPQDPWTKDQLRLAYTAANDVAPGGFGLFISFDMAAGEWKISQVISLINEFKALPAQYEVDGLPLVSTFEGAQWAGNWDSVRQVTGGIFLVPSWTSIGPHGVFDKLDVIDGACEFV